MDQQKTTSREYLWHEYASSIKRSAQTALEELPPTNTLLKILYNARNNNQVLWAGQNIVPEDVFTACDFLVTQGYISAKSRVRNKPGFAQITIVGGLRSKGQDLYHRLEECLAMQLSSPLER